MKGDLPYVGIVVLLPTRHAKLILPRSDWDHLGPMTLLLLLLLLLPGNPPKWPDIFLIFQINVHMICPLFIQRLKTQSNIKNPYILSGCSKAMGLCNVYAILFAFLHSIHIGFTRMVQTLFLHPSIVLFAFGCWCCWIGLCTHRLRFQTCRLTKCAMNERKSVSKGWNRPAVSCLNDIED